MQEIGIAIPFHRNLSYLQGAIESVVSQSAAAWRLAVVDDSGDGESETAVRELVASFEDERIHYERNPETLGMVSNWNRCIDHARSPLVTLLHGDDRLLPNYVAEMQRSAEIHPGAAALYCGAEIIDAAGRATFSLQDRIKSWLEPRRGDETLLRGEPGATALMRGNFIMCPTLCFRRSVLGARRFDHGWQQVQDLELTVRLLMEGETIVGSPAVAYAYRRHDASATSLQSESRLRFDEEIRLFDAIGDRAEALGWSETARVARTKRIVKLHLLYRALHALARGRLQSASDTLRYLVSHWS